MLLDDEESVCTDCAASFVFATFFLAGVAVLGGEGEFCKRRTSKDFRGVEIAGAKSSSERLIFLAFVGLSNADGKTRSSSSKLIEL